MDISSLSSASSSSTSSIFGSTSKGIGGLVSGLDTDSLIDAMTSNIRSKIAKQKQSKQILEWKMDGYRSVSTKLIDFENKYTSYSSSTNLYSENFFARNVITASGDNSKYVTVSGTASSSTVLALSGVTQLAKDASFTTSAPLSDNYIQTGAISYGDMEESTITGEKLKIQHGDQTYYVAIPEKDGGGAYTSVSEVADAINSALSKTDLTGDVDGKLSSVLAVSADGDKLKFTNMDMSGNDVKITGGDTNLITTLGLKTDTDTIIGKSITGSLDGVADINTDDLSKTTTFAERLSGKSVMFTYNGSSKTIKFDDTDRLTESEFKNYLQDELDSNFGNGRINVTDSNGGLKLETTTPDGAADTTSVLKMSSSSTGLFGSYGVFGIESGTSNKVNLDVALESSGLKGADNVSLTDGENVIRINGKDVKFTYEAGKTSLADIMEAINNSDADVKISYMENSDKFSVASTQKGASGDVTFGDESTGELNDLEKLLFGKKDENGDILSSSNELNGIKVNGQDAKIMVDFDGEGGADPVEVTRASNSFTLDGLNISVNGCFGYDSDGNKIDGSDVTFDASADVDSIVSTVKSMIDDYNEIVTGTNTAVNEKRNYDYAPLTDEQKKGMSESEITAWDKKAQAGMLFGNSDMVDLTNDLRYAFLDTRTDGLTFSDIGISVSSDYSDNGKITLDESKLRSVLESNPEDVQKLFTSSANDSNYTSSSSSSSSLTTGGAMTRLRSIMEKYASTTGATKGILVEQAGNPASITSMLSNNLQKQIDDIDDNVSDLNDKLTSDQARYQSKFTELEQVVQKMNTQSSYLSNMFSSGS
ncbi:MAG: flagellar filament capping protein FliD [Clostridia bacterium]|jgi:flagellar hook-associated protein 2|nr:flagellar filament capping protein FliD [Clostridia bacterium]